jgi:SAM-dependent methyltransferase
MALILDVGAGQGTATKLFRSDGHSAIAVNGNIKDHVACLEQGLDSRYWDMHHMNFIGSPFDLIWARHILEHSAFPMFALYGFNTVLKPGGLMYVEVPSPDTPCKHETNPNHWSVFGLRAWEVLIHRAGFELVQRWAFDFEVADGQDRYFAWLWRKP